MDATGSGSIAGDAGRAARGWASGAVRPAPAARGATIILSNALEFYDFGVYAAFAVAIGRAFFPTDSRVLSLLLSVATFGVGFLARPLGGLVIGAFADRHGRRPAMTLTVCAMAAGSGFIGLLPGYATLGVAAPALLVVARLLQGFSAGGEMGAVTCYLVESARPGRRGLRGSWQFAGQNMGFALVGTIGLGLGALMPSAAIDAWGWRVPFLIGVVLGPVGLYARRTWREGQGAASAHGSVRAVVGDVVVRRLRTTLLGALVISGVSVGQYFFVYNTTFALAVLGYGKDAAMATNLAIGVTGVAFSLVGGLAADRWGLMAAATAPRLLFAALLQPALLLVVASRSPAVFLVVMMALMAVHAAAGAAAIVLVPTLFPARVRTAGLSLAYALGVAAFGGTAQVIFTALIAATGDRSSWAWYVVATSLVSAAAAWAARPFDETSETAPSRVPVT